PIARTRASSTAAAIAAACPAKHGHEIGGRGTDVGFEFRSIVDVRRWVHAPATMSALCRTSGRAPDTAPLVRVLAEQRLGENHVARPPPRTPRPGARTS